MPLLPPEPFLFPEDLLSRAIPGLEEGSRWWVLHTRPRSEKGLARRLLARSTAFFLPLHQRQWKSRGRLFRSQLPLFPGYLFLHGDTQARLAALETNLVATCLPVTDQHQLHADLVRVHRLIREGEPLTPEERVGPGTPVEIVGGPLTGLTGKVLSRGKKLRLVVEVQLLQRGVSVEIEQWMVQVLDSRPPAAAVRA
jgi:transcriptional antiterminator RfaH